MANKFKYNKTGTEIDSIFKGNWAIDTTTPDSGGGPSSTTGLYHGAEIPSGGYTIYSPGSVYTATTDDELLGKVRDLGGDYGSMNAALTWIAGQPDIIVLNKAFDNLVTDGLVINLDASNISSFVDNKPTTNLLAAYNDNFVRAVTWTNSGTWIWNHNATNNDKPIINGIDLSNVNLMYGKSVTTGSQHFGCTQVTVSPSETYTMSVYYYHSRAGASSPYMRTGVNNNNLGYMSYNGSTNTGSWPVGQWIRVSVTATVQSNENRVYLSNYLGRQVDDQVWYCAPQTELGTEMTAFAKGTRLQNTTLYDLSNSDNHGVLTNAPTFNSNGWVDFDGVDDELIVADDSTLDLTTSMSFEFLVKVNSSQNNPYPRLIDKSAYLVHLSQTSPFSIAQNVNTSSGLRQVGVGSAFSSDDWTHILTTYDGQVAKIYKNGELIATNSWGSVLGATTNNTVVTIGGDSATSRQLNGSIAKTSIYDKALSEDEVSQNYYQAPIVTGGLVFAVDAGNLVSYENDSTTAYNLAGSETGTLTNGVGFDSNNGGSFTFDGIDEYINTDFTIPSGNRSMDLWIKYDTLSSSSGGGYSLTGVQQSGGKYLYTGISSNGGGYSYAGDTGGSYNYTFSANVWYYVVTVMDSGTTRHYVNGEQVATRTYASSVASTTPVMIGAVNNIHEVDGSIPITRIYNKALTAAEVTQNFNAQRNRFGI